MRLQELSISTMGLPKQTQPAVATPLVNTANATL